MQRVLTIAAASIVAALILWFALTTGPVITEDDRPRTTGPIELPDAFDGTNLQELDAITPPLSDQGTIFLAEQRTWLTWTTLKPEPDGIFEIQGPVARTALADGSVLEIVANEGSFFAPQRQPRHGEFRGEVVINLYRTEAGEPPKYGADDDVLARAYLDEVRFDLEIGLLEAIGPLHLTGPAFDFKGQRLLVRYNQLLDRLEELRIDESQSLRIKSDQLLADAETSSASPPTTTPDTAPASTNAEPTQSYQLTLTDMIQAQIMGDRAILTGQTLQALFSFERIAASTPTSDLSASPTAAEQTPQPAETTVAFNPEEVQTADRTPTDRSLCPVEPTDTIISWRGPLTVAPAEVIPGLPMPEPGQVIGRLLGSNPQDPALLVTDNARVAADAIGYDSLNQTFWAEALTEAIPAVLRTAEAGTVQADRLAYSLELRTAELDGPGAWEAGPSIADEHPHARDMTWQNRLTFQLTDTPQGIGPIAQLQSAQATGSVSLSLDEGYVDTESLAFVRQENNQALLIASEGVNAIYAPADTNEPSEPPLTLMADSAQIRIQETDTIQPLEVAAQGAARLTQGTQSARAESLRATLLQDPSNPNQPVLDRILAAGDIVLSDTEDRVEATGQNLTIFAQQREAILQGGQNPEDEWASLSRANSKLEGLSISGWQDQGLLAVDGPGRVTHTITPPPSTQATPALPPLPGLEPRQPRSATEITPLTDIQVNWSQGMTYNQQAGLVRAQGDVRGRLERGDETATLAVDEVRIGLDPNGSPSADPGANPQAIRTILATGNAELAYARHNPLDDRTIRTTLHGPTIAYDRDAASAEVLGDGWLLYEAFGTPENLNATDAGPGVFPIDLQAGNAQRGLLIWNDLMTLDLESQQAQADGGVELMYEASNEQPIFIDARSMTAQFVGLAAQDRNASPDLREIRALQDVQIVNDQRLITADGLSFDTALRTVVLWAEEDGLVREASPDQPAGFAAKRVRWVLDRDEVDVLEPAPVTLPVGDLDRRPSRFRR